MCEIYNAPSGGENTDSAIRLRLIDSTLFMIDRDGFDRDGFGRALCSQDAQPD